MFLNKFKGKTKTTQEQIRQAIEKSKYYQESNDEEIDTAAERIYNKLQIINSEYLQWFEILLACVFAVIGYMAPIWMLYFQFCMDYMGKMELSKDCLNY